MFTKEKKKAEVLWEFL